MGKLDFLSLQAFAIDVDAFRKRLGSKDESLVAAATKKTKAKPWNEILSYDGGEHPLIPGVKHLVMKSALPKATEPRHVFQSLRLLASLGGKSLPVSTWRSFGPEELEALDKALAQLGAKLDLSTHIATGSPVKLPKDRYGSIVGCVEAGEVARAAPLLAAAVSAGKQGSPPVDQCEMQKGSGKKLHTWIGSVVGSDVVQIYRAPSGTEERNVSRFKTAELARPNYESYITDREAEGYKVTARTEAPRGGAGRTKRPVIAPKLLARLEEASTWYAAAVKAKRGLMFFSY